MANNGPNPNKIKTRVYLSVDLPELDVKKLKRRQLGVVTYMVGPGATIQDLVGDAESARALHTSFFVLNRDYGKKRERGELLLHLAHILTDAEKRLNSKIIDLMYNQRYAGQEDVRSRVNRLKGIWGNTLAEEALRETYFEHKEKYGKVFKDLPMRAYIELTPYMNARMYELIATHENNITHHLNKQKEKRRLKNLEKPEVRDTELSGVYPRARKGKR